MRKLLIKVNEKTGKVNLLLILSEINLSFTDREGKQKKQKSVKKYPTVQSILYFYWTSEKSKYENRGQTNEQQTTSQSQEKVLFVLLAPLGKMSNLSILLPFYVCFICITLYDDLHYPQNLN
jgi:hypothetical protein